jgi:hypothetical protein
MKKLFGLFLLGLAFLACLWLPLIGRALAQGGMGPGPGMVHRQVAGMPSP